MRFRSPFRAAGRLGPAIVLLAVSASVAAAHDTWLLPDLFDLAVGTPLQVSARAGGGKFPAGSAVPLARIAEVRIIGDARDERVADVQAGDGALRIRHAPTVAGQYRVTLSLAPGSMRSTLSGLLRFLRAEGGVLEADRIAGLGVANTEDSVTFVHAASASVFVDVGDGGARSFRRRADARAELELEPLNDPSKLTQGDTLRLRVWGSGSPVARIGVEYKPAADTLRSNEPPTAYRSVLADAEGVVRLPLPQAGPWIVRVAYASARKGERLAVAREFSVARATLVVRVRGPR